MGKRLADKVAIITGVGSGIGQAAALLFAAEGASIVGCDIDAARCQATVDEITASGGRAVASGSCDPSDPEQAQELVDIAVRTFGRLDVLYNHAGLVHFAPVEQMTSEMWKATMTGELDIVFNACKAAWPHLKRRGGSIINCGSVSGKLGFAELPAIAHAAGKGGVIAMTRQLAVEGGPHAIRVNSISPGLVRTGATAGLMEDAAWIGSMKRKLVLGGRVGEPEDIAYCALYLASDEARWVTGADFAVDGGTSCW